LLLKSLDRARFSPMLFTLQWIEPSVTQQVDCPVESLNVQRLFSFGSIRKLLSFARLLRKSRVQIVQVFFIDSNIFGVLAAWFARVPCIIVSRRDLGYWYGGRRLKLVNLINRLAHYCLTNARAVRDVVLENETFTPQQVAVIYNGIENQDTDQPVVTRETFGIPPDAPVVGIVANLKPIKRVDRFLAVAERLTDERIHFMIVGTGRDQKALMKAAENLSCADRVHFYHTVDHVLDVIRLFDVGVLTSESEGLSNVLIEYALLGVPAVAFDTGGNAEVIIDDRTGFVVPPYNLDLMVERIDSLSINASLRQQMSSAARSRVNEMFEVKVMVQRTQDFYIQALSSKRIDMSRSAFAGGGYSA
jgi:glycosyltransferase involved in cell wall biosynthesis